VSAHGKQYRNARSAFDREHEYSPVEAIRMLKDMQTAKFDETVEVHFRSGSTSAMPTSSCAGR